mmetsp:Transcript_49839/g.149881  ORF Transcript_49839/g.149881 Transcript_49839/m.149881 type:complete len:244 (-) Transcript_49839:131-862(-)
MRILDPVAAVAVGEGDKGLPPMLLSVAGTVPCRRGLDHLNERLMNLFALRRSWARLVGGGGWGRLRGDAFPFSFALRLLVFLRRAVALSTARGRIGDGSALGFDLAASRLLSRPVVAAGAGGGGRESPRIVAAISALGRRGGALRGGIDLGGSFLLPSNFSFAASRFRQRPRRFGSRLRAARVVVPRGGRGGSFCRGNLLLRLLRGDFLFADGVGVGGRLGWRRGSGDVGVIVRQVDPRQNHQ